MNADRLNEIRERLNEHPRAPDALRAPVTRREVFDLLAALSDAEQRLARYEEPGFISTAQKVLEERARADAAEQRAAEAEKRVRVEAQAAIAADEKLDAAEKWQQEAEQRAVQAEARATKATDALAQIANIKPGGVLLVGGKPGTVQQLARAALTTHPEA